MYQASFDPELPVQPSQALAVLAPGCVALSAGQMLQDLPPHYRLAGAFARHYRLIGAEDWGYPHCQRRMVTFRRSTGGLQRLAFQDESSS